MSKKEWNCCQQTYDIHLGAIVCETYFYRVSITTNSEVLYEKENFMKRHHAIDRCAAEDAMWCNSKILRKKITSNKSWTNIFYLTSNSTNAHNVGSDEAGFDRCCELIFATRLTVHFMLDFPACWSIEAMLRDVIIFVESVLSRNKLHATAHGVEWHHNDENKSAFILLNAAVSCTVRKHRGAVNASQLRWNDYEEILKNKNKKN